MFGLTPKNAKSAQDRYDRSVKGRTRGLRKYHKKTIAPLTSIDNLTSNDIERIWNLQGGRCICCGQQFESLDDCDIDHISGEWLLRADNCQLICPDDNQMKRGLVLPFSEIKRQYGKNFLQLVREYPDWVQKIFMIDGKTMKRIIRWADRKAQGE